MGLVSRARAVVGANYAFVVPDRAPQTRRKVALKTGRVCGKDAIKWLVCERLGPILVDKCPKSVYKFVISLFGLGGEKKVWHSITRSSRSTCQQTDEPQGEKEAGG